jgi:hypothetical protein
MMGFILVITNQGYRLLFVERPEVPHNVGNCRRPFQKERQYLSPSASAQAQQELRNWLGRFGAFWLPSAPLVRLL